MYVQRQIERIPACVTMQSNSCDQAEQATIDAQFKLRIATEKAWIVLDAEEHRRLSAVEAYFGNLYARNLTGSPPSDPVDTEGLHGALVELGRADHS